MRISDWSSDVCSSDLHWIAQLKEVLMAEDMVMRSVYVRPGEDADLRQLAHDFNVTKRDLIRSAIRLKLKEWLADNSGQKLLADEIGRASCRERVVQKWRFRW